MKRKRVRSDSYPREATRDYLSAMTWLVGHEARLSNKKIIQAVHERLLEDDIESETGALFPFEPREVPEVINFLIRDEEMNGQKSIDAAKRIWQDLELLTPDQSTPRPILMEYRSRPRRVKPSGIVGAISVQEFEGFVPASFVDKPYSIPKGYVHALDSVCRRMAAQYYWEPSGALIALLCGKAIAPVSHIVRIDFDFREDLPCTSRISLTIDPTMSPEQVLTIYSHARSQLIGYRKSPSRQRLKLVEFIAKNGKGIVERQTNFQSLKAGSKSDKVRQAKVQTLRVQLGNEWSELMTQWNHEHGKMRSEKKSDSIYTNVAYFRIDVMNAWFQVRDPINKSPKSLSQYPPIEKWI